MGSVLSTWGGWLKRPLFSRKEPRDAYRYGLCWGGYSLLFAASLTFVSGIARESRAQTLIFAGNVSPVPAAVSLSIGPGSTNTKQVGAFPAIWNIDVAVNTSEAQSGLDLDGSGAIADPLGGVARILDLDARLMWNTTVPALLIRNALTITQPTATSGVYAAWISREDHIGNMPFPAGPAGSPGPVNVNADGDVIDWVVVIMAYKNIPLPAAVGDCWVLAPAASPGVSTGFIGVHMNGEVMVVEQGGGPFPPLPSNPPLPILVLDLQGYGVPQIFAGGGPQQIMPNPIPSPIASGGSGHFPKANFLAGLTFPQSLFIVFEQRETQLGASFNPDGDTCDRVIAFQEITGINTACPFGLVCPPAFGTVSLSLSGVCLMGVGNLPSTRPHATLGSYVGFDVVPAGQQAGIGPDCGAVAIHSDRGRANPTTSAPCASGYSMGNNMLGERVSVAGPVFAHVVRETAPGVGDANGDGFVDPGVVVWINQTTWPPTGRWLTMGPGNEPAAENSFNFAINPLPPGTYIGLTAYEGVENYAALGDLNGDGDQTDQVIMVHLR